MLPTKYEATLPSLFMVSEARYHADLDYYLFSFWILFNSNPLQSAQAADRQLSMSFFFYADYCFV